MNRARRHWTKPLALTLVALSLAGCVSTSADPETGQYVTTIGNAPVTSNQTPYSRALACLAATRRGKPIPRIAVGQIADYTGKAEADGAGRKLTQGAALMAMSALSKAGIQLVERYDTSVAELELKYANNRLIGAETPQDQGYRRILAGSIPGSDFYLVGGITELNYNIRSMGADAFASGMGSADAKGNAGYKAYVMNVGLDLRLVDTRTLEVVDVISYQKQIVGREVQAGVFDILGTTILDAGAGESALEPIQLAVRAVIERAVLEMISRLYHVGPDVCSGALAGTGDPLAGADEQPPPPPPPGPAPAPPPDAEPQAAIAPSQEQATADEVTTATQVAPAEAASTEVITATQAAPAEAASAEVTTATQAAPAEAATAETATDQPVVAQAEAPAPQSQPQAQAQPQENVNEARQDPYRWYGGNADGPSLRGGV